MPCDSLARCTLGAQRRRSRAPRAGGKAPHPPPFRACLLFPHEPTPPCSRRFSFFPFPSPSFHPILVAPSSRRSLTSFSLPLPPSVFAFLTTVTPLEYQFGSPVHSFRASHYLHLGLNRSRRHRLATHRSPAPNTNNILFPFGSRTTLLTAYDYSILFSNHSFNVRPFS